MPALRGGHPGAKPTALATRPLDGRVKPGHDERGVALARPSVSVILERRGPLARRRLGDPGETPRETRLYYRLRMRHRDPVVYILASARNGTIYVGVTADLITRLVQHRSGEVGGFTKTYHVHLLVHVEWYGSMPDAIAREKQLKKWGRARKIALIEAGNPTWRDFCADFAGPDLPR